MGEKATIEWSDTNRRKAELANEKLLEHGHEIRIDHRSLSEQGIEREPTTHLGPAVSGMERRGIETEVGKRLDAQALEAAQQRLEKAAEWAKVERESRELSASIVDVSGNLEAAKSERDLMLARGKEQTGPKPSLEELQREGRERWLAYRAEREAQGAVLTPEQERQQARERWQEYRRNSELEKEKGRESSLAPERKGPEKERGLERDGLEFE